MTTKVQHADVYGIHVRERWRAEINPTVALAKVFGPKHEDGGDYAPLFETYDHEVARLAAAAPQLLNELEIATRHIRTLLDILRGSKQTQARAAEIETVSAHVHLLDATIAKATERAQ